MYIIIVLPILYINPRRYSDTYMYKVSLEDLLILIGRSNENTIRYLTILN